MDIRGRCDYLIDKNNFRLCPARIDTMYIHLSNDYDTYKMLEKTKTKKEKNKIIKKFIHNIIGIRFLADKEKVIEMYWKQIEEDI